jgi:hypothetical protein
MKDKITIKANNGINRVKRFTKNVETFVQAVSMLVLTTFAFWSTRQLQLNQMVRYVVVTALVIIGLRGMYEFVRFLDAERK